MFDKLVLSDAYYYTFASILVKYGFYKLSEPFNVLGSDFLTEGGIRRVGEKKFSNMVMNIYQMSLLFDEFVLYDYTDEPGSFDSISDNKFIRTTLIKGSSPYRQESVDDLYIQEYIMPILMKSVSKLTILNSFGRDTIYDILDTILQHKTYKLYSLHPGIEWVEIENRVLGIVHDITDLHELSAKNDCPLLSLDYDFSNTHAECRSTYEYALIRVAYEKIVSKIPTINSAYDVLKLKRSKRKEIKNFQKVMEEFDQLVRSGGEKKAIEKISEDMKKVSIELSMGTPAATVSKWATMFLVPVSVVERLLDLPPIGLSIEVIAWVANSYIKKKQESNNWLELII